MIVATTTLLLLINVARKPILPLKEDKVLSSIAMDRCVNMRDFSHTDYYNVYSKIIEKTYKNTGENLAIGFPDATTTVQAWLRSPTHKEILKAKRYQKIGLAVCQKAPNVYLTVTLYGGNK